MLVVATNNQKKLRELREILAAIAPQAEVRSAGELGLGSPEETGATFVDNAVIKALAAFRETGALSLADDSGLEVDALGGAPGVLSARFAGPDATDADNNTKLMAALSGLPKARRGARYRAVVALIVPEPLAELVPASARATPIDDGRALLVTTSGTIEGEIVDEAQGGGGFGYDPYFFYPPAGCTFAELPAEQKHAVSHRGQALRRLTPVLRALLSPPTPAFSSSETETAS